MTTPYFASHGAEKMLYDSRMQTQAILLDTRLYVVYQAGEHDKSGHPHIVWLDMDTQQWSEPLQLGMSAGADHHFAPILWTGRDKKLHVLYHCHRTPARHLISCKPNDPTRWEEGPHIADSMSYPTVWRTDPEHLVLVYRVQGHLGYWVCCYSKDDGYTWSAPHLLTDFDHDPQDETDRWAGSYLATLPAGGTSLHVGFVHWEERDNINLRYQNFTRDLFSRYNMYYLQVDWKTGQMSTVDGAVLSAPVTRRAAERCKIMDTDFECSNFPSITADAQGNPLLLAPVSQGSPWHCRFTCFRWDGVRWHISQLQETDNIWNSSLVWHEGGSHYKTWLVVGQGKDERCFYGGGTLELWASQNFGQTWSMQENLQPCPELIYNNPKQVFRADGTALPGWMIFFGWQGPESMWKVDNPKPNRGFAFLYADGRIIGRTT